VLADLQNAGERLEQHLADRRRAGISHRTINGDLVAVRSFCRWLIYRRRMHEDPTRGLERLNQDVDRRRERRALTDSEIGALFTVTQNSKRIAFRLTGRDRALLYLVALRTGLRRGELQSLMTRSFDFSVSPPTVTVEAAKSKHRRTDILPLSAEIAALLQPHLLIRSSGEPVWPGSWWRQASKMLARDLTDAGISGIDANGRVVDFHALRTTFITGLARAGVMPAMAQRLARHSDINLTLGVYTQLQLSDLANAVEKLPILAAKAG
jgi:site-specific recombinase XerC